MSVLFQCSTSRGIIVPVGTWDPSGERDFPWHLDIRSSCSSCRSCALRCLGRLTLRALVPSGVVPPGTLSYLCHSLFRWLLRCSFYGWYESSAVDSAAAASPLFSLFVAFSVYVMYASMTSTSGMARRVDARRRWGFGQSRFRVVSRLLCL